MGINATHPKYKENINNWKKIDDILGNKNVENYLIKLNPTDTSKENDARNEAYKKRAVFYSLAEYTVDGMLGNVFSKQPELTVPSNLEYISKNVDGAGNSIYQQSQAVMREVIGKSRAGLYVSYPDINAPVSMADVASGKYIASIQHISAERIINWRLISVGAIIKLGLVVFTDTKDVFDNYEMKNIDIIRELYIDDVGGRHIYKERHWIKNDKDEWVVDEVGERVPTDAKGMPFDSITFQFVGGKNNDSNVDSPNMLGMVNLNIAHYRNSADYEDTVWFAGQSQPWMSGVDQEHINLLKNNNMYIGSRQLMAVPSGESFGFASATPNPAVRQAMIDKVDMMVGIGARMIRPGGVAKTAEQTAGEREVQHSILSLAASNVSEAYSQCLVWVDAYMSAAKGSGEFEYEINQDFNKATNNPAELREIIAGFMAGAIPSKDYINFMKKYGIFDKNSTDEEYASELPAPSEGDFISGSSAAKNSGAENSGVNTEDNGDGSGDGSGDQ